ncbi:MAG: hypothetical protein LQ343_004265 [Gyalolechia ehrenbergii]|nr:MAG: hypothetical protein LQ343_004265 [Gyalolechia ehrenbergii]
MKLSLELLCAPLLVAVALAAPDASIYISGSPVDVPRHSLSPDATRLLLARRLGLSQYHSLEGAYESILKILNDFGGEQRALLPTEEQGLSHQRNLMVIDGVESPEEITKSGFPEAALTISNPPYSSHTLQLVRDLFRQAQDALVDGHRLCSYGLKGVIGISGGILHSSISGQCADRKPSTEGWTSLLRDISSPLSSRTTIVHISLPDAISSTKAEASKALSQSLSHLLRPDSGHETTIILMPPSSPKNKRTSTSPYGSYKMPESAPLQARDEVQSEAPLTIPSAPPTSLVSHRPSPQQLLKASSVPRVGILPVCQSSLEKLIDATNNCSGHGLPYLKHNGTSDTSSDCYACKCRKTIFDRGDGKGAKTVEWAGPACSKKDISIPFWLLAGISIGLVATVSWGIGLLFSIGQEELPSVIGAGVAGPRAQR